MEITLKDGAMATCSLRRFVNNVTLLQLVYDIPYFSGLKTSRSFMNSDGINSLPDDALIIRLDSYDRVKERLECVSGEDFRVLSENGFMAHPYDILYFQREDPIYGSETLIRANVLYRENDNLWSGVVSFIDRTIKSFNGGSAASIISDTEKYLFAQEGGMLHI